MIQTVNNINVHLEKCNADDLSVARAAWVSNFGEDAREKQGARVEGLIKFLYSNKHMSPFEHGQFTFFIDCPLFVAREFMRHRTFSYNETSGRYKEMEGRFYLPPFERPLIQTGKVGAYIFEPGTEEMYAKLIQRQQRVFNIAWEEYQGALDDGVAREVARNVLPLALYTQFYASVNPRNLMHFLSLRNDPTALEEIRWVAQAMELILEAQMPYTYSAYKGGQ